MARSLLLEIPNLGRRAAKCRKRAQLCRTRAAKTLDWREEVAWLEHAAEWIQLAEAFENEDRLLLN
jgi:hypothetical protein